MTTLASDDQMIDGKLSDSGKQTDNMQVVMGDTGPGAEFGLEDKEGQFLVVPAEATNPQYDYAPVV